MTNPNQFIDEVLDRFLSSSKKPGDILFAEGVREAYSIPVTPPMTEEKKDALICHLIEAGIDLDDPEAVRNFLELEAMRRAYGWDPNKAREAKPPEEGGAA